MPQSKEPIDGDEVEVREIEVALTQIEARVANYETTNDLLEHRAKELGIGLEEALRIHGELLVHEVDLDEGPFRIDWDVIRNGIVIYRAGFLQ